LKKNHFLCGFRKKNDAPALEKQGSRAGSSAAVQLFLFIFMVYIP
jgi:hypothetical protein